MRFTLDDPPFAGNGEDVSIAVIDSGVNVDHPHVGAIEGGVSIDTEGAVGDDFVDRLGHGTAVTAAIQEKAPAARVWAVKVFDTSLATSAAGLARAIEWAVESRIDIANLSLGTPVASRETELLAVVERAARRGTLVVSAARHRDAPWWPGCLEAAVGVYADLECGRDELRVEPDGTESARLEFHASPLPRPIPGVSPENNLRGISFAVANTSGFLARALQTAPAGGNRDLRRLLGLPRVG